MEDLSPSKVVDGSSMELLTTNAEVSIASEFDYDPSKYHGSTASHTLKPQKPDYLGMSCI